MSGEIFPLIIGFLIISLFLFSIEILNKRQFEKKKIIKHSHKLEEKTK
jgi:hypothetical protein